MIFHCAETKINLQNRAFANRGCAQLRMHPRNATRGNNDAMTFPAFAFLVFFLTRVLRNLSIGWCFRCNCKIPGEIPTAVTGGCCLIEWCDTPEFLSSIIATMYFKIYFLEMMTFSQINFRLEFFHWSRKNKSSDCYSR